MLLGDYMAYAAMLQGKHVAYIPSYGPETRGGKAKCYVIISDEVVDNPIAEEPDVELIMNQPSMDFLNDLRPRGLIIYNQSLIQTHAERDDVESFGIPATEIAESLRNENPSKTDTKMFANAVMFGAFLELCTPNLGADVMKETLKHFLAGKKESLMSLNILAIEKGRAFVKSNPLESRKNRRSSNSATPVIRNINHSTTARVKLLYTLRTEAPSSEHSDRRRLMISNPVCSTTTATPLLSSDDFPRVSSSRKHCYLVCHHFTHAQCHRTFRFRGRRTNVTNQHLIVASDPHIKIASNSTFTVNLMEGPKQALLACHVTRAPLNVIHAQ